MEDILNESGGISGAITNPDSPEAVLHAYKYYDFIRKINYDIDNIAKNTDFTKDQIIIVKNYIFYAEHELIKGYCRFDPDFFMAQSWKRLAFEPDKIQEHDIIMIKHELYEISLVTQGYNYHVAHEMSNKAGFNYEQASKEYYEKLEEKQNKHKNNKEMER